MAEEWVTRTKQAVGRQRRAQAEVANGKDPASAATGINGDTRAIALDRVAQFRNVIKNKSRLPETGQGGVTDGQDRGPVTKEILDNYAEQIEQIVVVCGFTDAELEDADKRLEFNLDAGVSIDPAASANVEYSKLEDE